MKMFQRLLSGTIAVLLAASSSIACFAKDLDYEDELTFPKDQLERELRLQEEKEEFYDEISPDIYAATSTTTYSIGNKPTTYLSNDRLNGRIRYAVEFTADKTAYLDTISFDITGALSTRIRNAYYMVMFYKSVKDPADPTSGTPCYKTKIFSDDFDNREIYSDIQVKQGETFSVVCYSNSSYCGLPVSEGECPNGTSFLSYDYGDDEWTDISDYGFTPCINITTRDTAINYEDKVYFDSYVLPSKSNNTLVWYSYPEDTCASYSVYRADYSEETETDWDSQKLIGTVYKPDKEGTEIKSYSFKDKNIETGKQYSYYVVGKTTSGYSASSDILKSDPVSEADAPTPSVYAKTTELVNISLPDVSAPSNLACIEAVLETDHGFGPEWHTFYFDAQDSTLFESGEEIDVAGGAESTIRIRMVYDNGEGPVYGGWSAPITITTPTLSSPIITKMTSDKNKVTLSWNAVSGADLYAIYSRDTRKDGYSEVLYATTTSATVTGFYGDTLTFYVTALNKDETIYSVDYTDETISAPIKLASPGLAKPILTDRRVYPYDQTVFLSWNPVSGATSYSVYFTRGSKYYLLGQTTDTKFSSESSEYSNILFRSGIGYFFVVAENGYTASAPSAMDAYACFRNSGSPCVEIDSIEKTSSGMVITMTSTVENTNALIFRSKEPDGLMVYVGEAQVVDGAATFTDTTVNSGLYYYTVVVADVSISSSGTSIYMDCVKFISFSTPTSSLSLASPSSLTATSSTAGVELSWDAVKGATSYRVYRANSATGTKTLLKGLTTTKYTDKPANEGTYYYFVTAYSSDIKMESAYSKSVSAVYSRLAAPSITSISTDGKSVTLAWNTVSGATSYRVYRADSATGAKTMLKVRTTPNYTDSTVEAGKTYYYFVAAYDANSGTTSAYSAAKSIVVKTPLAAPSISSISTDDKSVTLAWNTVSGATSYRVYRADSATGAKTMLKVRTTPNFTDSTVTTGKTYYYFVAAYDANSGTTSAYSAAKSIVVKTPLAAPSISSISTDGKSVTLAWNTVSGATSYRVYRADSATGAKTMLKVRTTPNFTDSTVEAGKTYYYFVAAYDANSGTTSAYSAAKSIVVKTPLAAPSISSISTDGKSVTLAWNTVSGATSYRVYRADSATGAKTMLKVRTTPNYTDSTVESGKTYYYFVAAYDANSGTTSAYSAAKSIVVKTPLAAPSITSISTDGKSVTLAWNTVSGATSYRVYRADSATGAKTMLKVRTSPNFTDSTVEAGKTYYYFVAAYDANSGTTSAYSAAKSIVVKTPLNAPSISSISTDGKSVTLAWNTVSGATSYRVYRADSATGAKTMLKVRTTPNFTDSTVEAGKTYYYFVAAYNANDSILSAYSSSESIAVE